ncbi:hypothetical protein V8E53_006106 [Lactarius tabidus]
MTHRCTTQPRRTHLHPSYRPKASSIPPALTINTTLSSHATSSRSSTRSSPYTSPSYYSSLPTPTSVAHDHQRQHRWSELVPPQTALTFVAMFDPSDGLLTFSGASLLPSEPPTPPTPTTPMLDTPDTPKARPRMQTPRPAHIHLPMPCTPAPSTLADMQSLLDVYFRSTACTNASAPQPARASSTFDGLFCVVPPSPAPDYSSSPPPSAGTGRDKPLPMRPPPPPDRDSVFAWSWLGRMEPDDPREPWNVCAGANTDANANADGFRCSTQPSMAADSGYESEMGCDDDDGDSFYYTPEFEDPNECSAFSVTTTSTSEYIDVPGRDCESIWSANVLAYAYPASAATVSSRADTRERGRMCGRARSPTRPSSPTSPAQALLHPWRLLRARTSHATFAGAGASTNSLQRRASRAASMFTKLGRLGSRDDGESWIYVEVVHTITQRPLRDCEW